MIKNPGFLVVPAYIEGITCVAAASQLLPQQIGMPIAAVLSIAMLTFFSLVHRALDDAIELHLFFWGVAFVVACVLNGTVFDSIPGPMVILEPKISWWQLAFVVTQQVFYFGIHAFTSESQ